MTIELGADTTMTDTLANPTLTTRQK